MYDIRLRRYADSGTTKGIVLPTLDIAAEDGESATARIRFTTTAKTAGRLSAPFIVGLEENTGGKFWTRPRNDLFIVLDDAEDAADQTDVMQFTAQSYVGWLLSKGVHWWAAFNSLDGKTRVYNATPGYILHTWFTEGQTQVATNNQPRGWAPSLTWDFTPTKDSLGQTWQAADTIEAALELWKPYSSFIQTWTEQGKFEWWAEGMKVRVARVGTGIDRTQQVTLGGPAFAGAPAKTTFQDVFSTLVMIPDKAGALSRLNPGADTRFGALETSMSLSGVDNWTAAEQQAQPAMQEGRAKKLELSFDWIPAAAGPIPARDFDIGDTVTARRRAGKVPQRVIGIQRAKRAGEPATVRAIVGDKLVGLQAKLAKRAGAVSTGTIIGGSGTALPSNPGQSPLKPAAPTALRVQSNVGSWRADGSAAATVVLAWDAVTTDVNGNRLDCDLYEIDSRLAAGAPQSQTTTTALTAMVTTWEPGTARYVRVRVRSVGGAWSAWSGEIAATPATPTSIIPKAPTGLTVASNTAAFQADGTALATVVMTWTPVTQSTDNTAVTIAEYEVTIGQDKVRTTAATVTFTIPSGATAAVTVRALTTLKVWGDPSTAVSPTGVLPAQVTTALEAPTLTTGAGIVAVFSSGKLFGGGPLPSSYGYTFTDTATSAAGPWTRLPAPASGAGQVATIKGTPGATVWVSLVWADKLGRVSSRTAAASIVVAGVGLPDFDQPTKDALDAIGDAVISVVTEYAVGPSETVAPTTGWSTATPTRTPGTFIWSRTTTTKGDGTTPVSSPVLVTGNSGSPGTPGTPGKGVASTAVTYQLAASGTTAPTGSWVASPPATSPGQFLWTRTIITYTDASTTTAYSVAAHGASGAAGVGVASTAVTYQVGSSGTTAPTGTWQSTVPTTPQGQFLWARTITTYSDSTTSTAYAVARQGTDGSPGTPGKGISSTVVTYQAATSGTVAPTGTWSSSVPSVTAGQFLWTRTVITYTDATTSTAYAVALQGATGSAGKGVTSVTPYYLLQGTGNAAPAAPTTNPPGGSWSITEPAYTASTELYRAELVLFTDSTFGWTAVSKVSAYTASSQAVTVANLADAAAKGTVKAQATDPGHQVGRIWLVLDGTGRCIGIKVSNGTAWTSYTLMADQIIVPGSVGAVTIADGAITGPKVNAGSIWANQAWIDALNVGIIRVDWLEPNIGEKLNLVANSAVLQIGGQLDDHSADLALKAQQITAAQSSADAAGQAAADAQGTAGSATVQASMAQQVAQATAQALTAHQSIFQITSDGARLITPDGSQALVLTPAGVAIQQNGIAQTTWTAGAMVVPNAILDGATIGTVRFEKSGTRTLVRQV